MNVGVPTKPHTMTTTRDLIERPEQLAQELKKHGHIIDNIDKFDELPQHIRRDDIDRSTALACFIVANALRGRVLATELLADATCELPHPLRFERMQLDNGKMMRA